MLHAARNFDPRAASLRVASKWAGAVAAISGTRGLVQIQLLDPLFDDRWDRLVESHPRGTVFHTRGWLEALTHTYGYVPVVLSTASPGEVLRDGVLACRVSSWMTGNRLVSLPFADHCEPLVERPEDCGQFIQWMHGECEKRGEKYFELRPLSNLGSQKFGLTPDRSCWFHELDLSPSVNSLYQRLHKNSFRRKIQRAERERLTHETGNSAVLLDEFYRLLLVTRRRHGLLPQPKRWFENLLKFMAQRAQISLARKDGRAIAAMFTLRHRGTVVYKYGCSEGEQHKLGAMPFLFWRLIQDSKASGAKKIDLGRTDCDNQGLMTFKDRMGAKKTLLTYYRYWNPAKKDKKVFWQSEAARQFFLGLPDLGFSVAGKMLYRHLG